MAETKHDSDDQAKRFRDMARELECDEDEAAFEDKVRRVATAPKLDEPEPHE